METGVFTYCSAREKKTHTHTHTHKIREIREEIETVPLDTVGCMAV